MNHLGVSLTFQHASNSNPGFMHLRLAASLREIHHARDLLVIVSLHVVKYEANAVADGKVCNSALKCNPINRSS